MENWDDFKYFLTLSRVGTFKETARLLKIDQATVGRRIYALEEKLKTKLFEKRSDGYFLTRSGLNILKTIEEVETSFQSIDRKITGQDELLSGAVRVAMPGALANHLIIPQMKEFTLQHPAIEVQFLTGGEVLNLAKREADMAFRLVRPTQTDLIVRKVVDLSLSVYASKEFLKKHGRIRKLEDLSRAPFVGLYERSESQIERKILEKLDSSLGPVVMRSSAWSSVYSAVTNDIGVGILPSFMASKNSKLEELDLGVAEKATLWFVIHPEVQKNKRFVALSEYLIRILREAL